ncbi:uncharacterized protein LOC111273559, partial [Varroa jacobsoni]|uniref:uncharacterized protein LOC111273559 n=1 Tax=Varroa jacobsoni TaxID=62625 RepID=UPI000BF53CC2
MSETQLGYRFLSNVSNLHANDIKNQKLNDFELTQLSQSTKIIDDMKLFIDDDVNLTINSLRAKAISMKMKHGIGLVIVDYLQLITTDENSSYREQEISKISRGLKKLSKELDIPVIALSQLSRKVEERGGAKRPILSDLRESGTLEQDADNVIFLLRQEYYLVEEDPEYTETNGSTKGILE